MSPWTQDDELEMVKLIRRKISLEDISKQYNRTVEDIEKRLKKVIYENIMRGKSCKVVSEILNLPEEKINLYFNSYKEYKKRHDEKHELNDNKLHHNEDHNNKNKINFDLKIEAIEKETRFLDAIIEKKKKHDEINEMINRGKINKDIKKIILDFRNNNH